MNVQSGAALRDATGSVETGDAHKIRLLVFTSLFPNAVQPHHGRFVEERLRHLVGSGRIEATVVAPVPWFPIRHPRFGAYAAMASVPVHERRHGLDVYHPRYPVIPKIGMNIAPSLMFRAMLPFLKKMQAGGHDFDLIDAHFFYPDGVVAAKLSVVVHRPVVITARGTDLNVIAGHCHPCREIRWAGERAAAVITVSRALREKAVALGVNHDKIVVLRNGVDLDRFAPRSRYAIRTRLDLKGIVWLTVGNLIEGKGVHLAIEALSQTSETILLVVGVGPEEARLRQLAERKGVQARVRFLGMVPRDELCNYYNSADVLIHASSREGMPNVVLESLACGTPVIAAPFESAGEIIAAPEAGEIALSRSADAIHAAWMTLLQRSPPHDATRRYAEARLGWNATVEKQLALYANIMRAPQSCMRSGATV